MITWSPGMSLDDIEEKVINKAMDYFDKNTEKTALSLKISLDELNFKIKKFAEKQKELQENLNKEKMKAEEFNRRERGLISPLSSITKEPIKNEEFNKKKNKN